VATAGSLHEPLPQSVGTTVAFRGAIKRRNPPVVLPLPVSPAFEFESVATLIFFPPASFGQPTTSPSLLLLRPLVE
jgi:hypothetical protein